MSDPVTQVPLRSLFAGRRGRLLAALLLVEFGVAVQGVAISTVLPLAADELDGRALYGASLAAGPLAMLLVLALGGGARLPVGPRPMLLLATAAYVVGMAMSVTATSMVLVFAGGLVRGLAGGLIAGFGLTAIGALFDDDVRPRVLSLFAIVWLLPSVVGPVVNSALAVTFGWRWALGWPAVVVVVGRLLIGRDADTVPWRASGQRLDPRPGLLVVLGLLATSVAPSLPGAWRVGVFAGGVLLALLPLGRVLGQAVPGDRSRLVWLAVFAVLTVPYAGATGLLSVAAIETMGRGVGAGAVAVGAVTAGWALTGFPALDLGRRRRDATVVGLVLVAAGLVLLLVAVSVRPTSVAALVALVVGSFVLGVGTGTSYPRLSSRAFDRLPTDRVSIVAVIVVFAEMSGTALGSSLGGGVYSLLTSLGGSGDGPVVAPFAVLVGLALVVVVVAARADRLDRSDRSDEVRRAPR